MTKDEKLGKVVRDFSMLPDDKQDLVLGILQALVFAGDGRAETAPGETHPKEADGTARRLGVANFSRSRISGSG